MTNSHQSDQSHPSDEKKYEAALLLKFYEGQIAWQMNILFIALNVGLGTILQGKLQDFSSFCFSTIFLSIIGLIINTLWLGTFYRNSKYYRFRMAQARHAEPLSFSLVNGRGYRFSLGKAVSIPGTNGDELETFKFNRFEKFCSNKKVIEFSIFCFIACFLVVLILSFLPCLKKELSDKKTTDIAHGNCVCCKIQKQNKAPNE